MHNLKNLLCTGAFLALGCNAWSDTIYNTAPTYNTNLFSVTSGQEIGNEITLSANTWKLTEFAIEYYSPSVSLSGTVGLRIRLYDNTGSLVNGYASPAALPFYDSGIFTGLATGAQTVTYSDGVDFSNLILPTDFTFTVTFTGVDNGANIVELPLANNPTGQAGISATFGDYWLNNGSSWELLTNSAAQNNMVVKITASTVPEPTVVGLGIAGVAMLLGARKLKRKA